MRPVWGTTTRPSPPAAGITRIVIPSDNAPDLEDLSQEVRDEIEVLPVATLAEALAVTLRDAALENGRLTYGGATARDTDSARDTGEKPLR